MRRARDPFLHGKKRTEKAKIVGGYLGWRGGREWRKKMRLRSTKKIIIAENKKGYEE